MIWWAADDCVTCVECGGRSHDAIRSRGKEALLECNYCGLKQWASNAPSPPREENHRMKSGRFQGMTFKEIGAMPKGRRYLEELASRDGELREVVSRYLAASQ